MPGLSDGGPGMTSGSSTSSKWGNLFFLGVTPSVGSRTSRIATVSVCSPKASLKVPRQTETHHYIKQLYLNLHQLQAMISRLNQQLIHNSPLGLYLNLAMAYKTVTTTFRSLLRILSPPSLLPRELRLSSTASKRRSTNPPADSSRKGRSWSLETEIHFDNVANVQIKYF